MPTAASRRLACRSCQTLGFFSRVAARGPIEERRGGWRIARRGAFACAGLVQCRPIGTVSGEAQAGGRGCRSSCATHERWSGRTREGVERIGPYGPSVRWRPAHRRACAKVLPRRTGQGQPKLVAGSKEIVLAQHRGRPANCEASMGGSVLLVRIECSPSQGTKPNPSIERTSFPPLRAGNDAAHVKR